MVEGKKSLTDYFGSVVDKATPLIASVADLVGSFKKERRKSEKVTLDSPLAQSNSKTWLVGGAIGLGVLILGVFALILTRGKN